MIIAHITTWEVVPSDPTMDRVWCHCGSQVVRRSSAGTEWADAVEAFESKHDQAPVRKAS